MILLLNTHFSEINPSIDAWQDHHGEYPTLIAVERRQIQSLPPHFPETVLAILSPQSYQLLSALLPNAQPNACSQTLFLRSLSNQHLPDLAIITNFPLPVQLQDI